MCLVHDTCPLSLMHDTCLVHDMYNLSLVQMREPAADLAIAVAIVSGYYGIPVPRDMVVIGEVGQS